MSRQLLEEPVCVVDVETWNPGGGRHQLIEIAAMVVDIYGQPVRVYLGRDGSSAGSGEPVMYQRLCRPVDLPPLNRWRSIRFHNALDPRWLYATGVTGEAYVVQDFAEWHFGCALSAPLVAWNNSFDRAALRGALRLSGSDGQLNWGRCLMLEATEVLKLSRADGRIRRKAPKEEIARQLFGGPLGVESQLKRTAHSVGWTGPLTMHLALPDVLLEFAIMVELQRRALPTPTMNGRQSSL